MADIGTVFQPGFRRGRLITLKRVDISDLGKRMQVDSTPNSQDLSQSQPVVPEMGESQNMDISSQVPSQSIVTISDSPMQPAENSSPVTLTEIKEEPDEGINLEHFLEQAGENYKLCEFHRTEMLEKNIVCLTCQTLMCAICLRDYHLKHEIVSVGKLKECRNIQKSVDSDITRLQMMHKVMVQQYTERKDLKQKVETSLDSLLDKVDTAFQQLSNIVLAKHKEIRTHIYDFSKMNIERLNSEMTKLSQMEIAAAEMIKLMLSMFTKSGVRQAEELPDRLKTVLEDCDKNAVPEVENSEKFIPENKFSKILPSLQAVSNICQTIHPEATKVVWSKVTPEKRKHLDLAGIDGKKIRFTPSATPPSQEVESSQQSVDSQDIIPDSSTVLEKDENLVPKNKPEFKLLSFDPSTIETVSTCRCVLLQNQEDHSQLAKVCDITRIREGWLNVKWLTGHLGGTKYFYLDKRKKEELVNIKNVICHFDFNFESHELPSPLKEELMLLLKLKPKSRRSKSRKSTGTDLHVA
ncbi:hypothetical protein ScPMuIL_018318 [Solemya velum]